MLPNIPTPTPSPGSHNHYLPSWNSGPKQHTLTNQNLLNDDHALLPQPKLLLAITSRDMEDWCNKSPYATHCKSLPTIQGNNHSQPCSSYKPQHWFQIGSPNWQILLPQSPRSLRKTLDHHNHLPNQIFDAYVGHKDLLRPAWFFHRWLIVWSSLSQKCYFKLIVWLDYHHKMLHSPNHDYLGLHCHLHLVPSKLWCNIIIERISMMCHFVSILFQFLEN